MRANDFERMPGATRAAGRWQCAATEEGAAKTPHTHAAGTGAPGRCATLFVFALLVLLALAPTPVAAHPSELQPTDARAQGMGGAFSAIAGGPFAVAWNPAALALPQPRLGIGYARFDRPGVGAGAATFDAYGFTYARSGVGLGVAFAEITAGDPSAAGAGPPVAEDRTVRVGLGVDLAWDLFDRPEHFFWGIGVSYKRLEETGGYTYEVACDETPRGFDLDAGMLWGVRLAGAGYHPPRDAQEVRGGAGYLGLRWAAVVRNLLNRTVVCLSGASERPIDRALHGSAALEFALGGRGARQPWLSGLLAAERQTIRVSETTPGWDFERNHNLNRYGAELEFLGLLAGRAGYVVDREAETSEWSWGAGARVGLRWRLAGFERFGLQADFARVPVGEYETGDHWTAGLWAR